MLQQSQSTVNVYEIQTHAAGLFALMGKLSGQTNLMMNGPHESSSSPPSPQMQSVDSLPLISLYWSIGRGMRYSIVGGETALSLPPFHDELPPLLCSDIYRYGNERSDPTRLWTRAFC